jgi:hypothetical protein
VARKPIVYERVLNEVQQGHPTRQPVFKRLEGHCGRPVVTFFTSFAYPVMINDGDADMLEGVLRNLDLSAGLALCVSSPGGDGLAAERIVKMCRTYSGTGEYWAIVPGKAKSAGTMICFGASKIVMGPTSELGPIDPQVIEVDPSSGQERVFSAYDVVESYTELFDRAVIEQNNLQPHLQALGSYDPREIKELRRQMELSEDIAARELESGMMKGVSRKQILKKIGMFLTPEMTKAHGRAIYRDEAGTCGLNIESADGHSDPWRDVYELYIRSNSLVQTTAMKCIESVDHSYSVGAQ